MRFSIHTLGTRGDMQPYLALARQMQARGHEVQIAAPEQFAGMATAENISFVPLPGEFLELMDRPEAKAALSGSKAGFGSGLKLLKYFRPLMRRLLDEDWQAASAFRPDAIIYHPKSIAMPHAAAKLGVPSFLASPLPGFTPTSAFPSPILPFASLGQLNRLSHAFAISGANVLFGKMIRQWRADTLGLPPRGKPVRPVGTLYAYSPHVLPKPADWGDDVAVTGYWFLDSDDWQPDPALAAFLSAGEPPIYVGFGSMPGLDPEEITRLVLEGLRMAGKRGLLATGGGALGDADAGDNAHFIGGAPHDRLFQRVHATLHHGGAGTTGAALRAGKPTAICPFFGDQPFWARRVVALGVGPAPLDRRKLTAGDLAAVFRAMDDPEMRQRAAGMGTAIRAEDGVGAALDFIGRRLGEAI